MNSSPRWPVSVLVEFSESQRFVPGRSLDYETFEKIATNVARDQLNGGYLKTNIIVTFNDGQTYSCRLDLGAHSVLNLADHIDKQKAFAASEKGIAFIQHHNLATLYAFIATFQYDHPALQSVKESTAKAIAENEEATKTAEMARLAAEDAARQETIRLDPANSHLSVIGSHGTTKSVLKNIRADLKKAFPGITFSVKKGGLGDAAVIAWKDGPSEPDVKKIMRCYEASTADPLNEDLEAQAWRRLFGSVLYVVYRRDFSQALCDSAMKALNSDYQTSYTVADLELRDIRVAGQLLQLVYNKYLYHLRREHDGRIL